MKELVNSYVLALEIETFLGSQEIPCDYKIYEP